MIVIRAFLVILISAYGASAHDPTTTELAPRRDRIDKIDRRLLEMLHERAEVVKQVAAVSESPPLAPRYGI